MGSHAGASSHSGSWQQHCLCSAVPAVLISPLASVHPLCLHLVSIFQQCPSITGGPCAFSYPCACSLFAGAL